MMQVAGSEQATRDGLALDVATLCEAFQRTAARHADSIALRTPGGEQQITGAEYAERARRLAGGSLKIRKMTAKERKSFPPRPSKDRAGDTVLRRRP